MSVDFGPVPMPTSPLQEYFERRMKASSATMLASTDASPSSPEPSPTKFLGHCVSPADMSEQLVQALTELAEKQQKGTTTIREEEAGPVAGRDAATTTGFAAAFAGNAQLLNRRNSGGYFSGAPSSRRPSS